MIAQIVAAAEGTPIEMRWPNLPTTAVACVGLGDGQERWRVALPSGEQIPLRPDTPRERKAAPLATGPMRIGQSVLAEDALFLFGASGIGASKFTGQIACIDTKTARLKWVNWTGTWGYNMVARNDRPYWFTPSTLFTADPHDVTISSFWTAGFNNRCNRSAATDEWLINGMGIWVDRQGQAVIRSIAYLLSQPLGLAYRVPRLPWAALVDARGVLRSHGLVNSREHLESLLEAEALGVASIQEHLAKRAQGGGA